MRQIGSWPLLGLCLVLYMFIYYSYVYVHIEPYPVNLAVDLILLMGVAGLFACIVPRSMALLLSTCTVSFEKKN